MQRRHLLAAAAGAAVAGPTALSAPVKGAILELRRYQLRNSSDNMQKRTTDFLKDAYQAAAQRAGATVTGFFGSVVGPESPFLLALTSYPSLAAMETANGKMADDRAYQTALEQYNRGGLGYVRMESSLLRAFEAMPAIEVPPVEGRQSPRLFELRTYESNNLTTLQRKIRMFAEGEIAIFRKAKMIPVFFGETIVGPNMPNLTYMLAYDDMTAREQVWKNFASSPEWEKLRSQPGLSDAEIVSNISNMFLRPLPFSAIR